MTRAGLVCLALALAPTVAAAHGVDAQCTADGRNVVVEVYYDTNEPAAAADVAVHDAAGRFVAKGVTDQSGVWSFPHPGPGDYHLSGMTTDKHSISRQFTLNAAGAVERSGVSRDLFTGYKWAKVSAGLLAVAALAVGLRHRARRAAQAASAPVQ